MAVDLFFNAGLLVRLWEQERERVLLGDQELFRRIPLAYLTFLVGVAALALLIEQLGAERVRRPAVLGGAFGAVAATMGVVGLWTAIDMSGAFVAAAAGVQIVEYAVAGGVLGAFSTASGRAEERRITRRAVLWALALIVVGVLLQNLIAPAA